MKNFIGAAVSLIAAIVFSVTSFVGGMTGMSFELRIDLLQFGLISILFMWFFLERESA